MGSRILLLTVGKGDIDNMEESLFVPLQKSVEKGEWERVVFLPSQVTKEGAELLQHRLVNVKIECRSLPTLGMEDDVDACFGYYDAVVEQFLEEGESAENLVADFTRGTKAMSAALVLASVRHGVKLLRYVHGERDQRGTVIPGTEIVADFEAALITTRRDLERAAQLLEALQFTAAKRMFGETGVSYPADLEPEVQWACWLGEFWGAWDRFDYRRAHDVADTMPGRLAPGNWARFQPAAPQSEVLARLARPLPTALTDMANALRDVAADLLANARRRFSLGQYEDTLLRAYRILELLGQIRLWERSLDSSNLDASRQDVQRWLAYMEKKEEPVLPEEGRIKLGRQRAARFLNFLGDPFAQRLLDESRFLQLQPSRRNQSLLIHGYEAKARGEMADAIGEMLDQLENLLVAENQSNRGRLDAVTFPFGGQPDLPSQACAGSSSD